MTRLVDVVAKSTDAVTLVSADRELQRRAEALGAGGCQARVAHRSARGLTSDLAHFEPTHLRHLSNVALTWLAERPELLVKHAITHSF